MNGSILNTPFGRSGRLWSPLGLRSVAARSPDGLRSVAGRSPIGRRTVAGRAEGRRLYLDCKKFVSQSCLKFAAFNLNSAFRPLGRWPVDDFFVFIIYIMYFCGRAPSRASSEHITERPRPAGLGDRITANLSKYLLLIAVQMNAQSFSRNCYVL